MEFNLSKFESWLKADVARKETVVKQNVDGYFLFDEKK